MFSQSSSETKQLRCPKHAPNLNICHYWDIGISTVAYSKKIGPDNESMKPRDEIVQFAIRHSDLKARGLYFEDDPVYFIQNLQRFVSDKLITLVIWDFDQTLSNEHMWLTPKNLSVDNFKSAKSTTLVLEATNLQPNLYPYVVTNNYKDVALEHLRAWHIDKKFKDVKGREDFTAGTKDVVIRQIYDSIMQKSAIDAQGYLDFSVIDAGQPIDVIANVMIDDDDDENRITHFKNCGLRYIQVSKIENATAHLIKFANDYLNDREVVNEIKCTIDETAKHPSSKNDDDWLPIYQPFSNFNPSLFAKVSAKERINLAELAAQYADHSIEKKAVNVLRLLFDCIVIDDDTFKTFDGQEFSYSSPEVEYSLTKLLQIINDEQDILSLVKNIIRILSENLNNPLDVISYINQRGNMGLTLLHLISNLFNRDAIEELLKAGADPNVEFEDKNLLTYIISNGVGVENFLQILSLYIKYGINLRDQHKMIEEVVENYLEKENGNKTIALIFAHIYAHLDQSELNAKIAEFNHLYFKDLKEKEAEFKEQVITFIADIKKPIAQSLKRENRMNEGTDLEIKQNDLKRSRMK